jgi:uncharacterized membrane protein YfcA
MFKSKEFGKDILAGIISALIFLILFQPIINALDRAIPIMGSNVLSNLSNMLYKNAALGHRNYVDVMLFLTFISIVIGAMVGALISLLIRKKISKIDERKTSKIQKFLTITLIVLLIYFLVDSTWSAILIMSDLQMNTSFEQRINVLAPYITEQQEKELRSSWALMQRRIDYEKINKTMNFFSQQYDIELPPLLWK